MSKETPGGKLTHEDLLARITENPPPERITITLKLKLEGGSVTETDFHFTRNVIAYERYVSSTWHEKKSIGPMIQFAVDTVEKAEQEALRAVLNAYPNAVLQFVPVLMEAYGGNIGEEIKNG